MCLTTLSATAAGLPRPAPDFPLPADSYHDQQIPSLFGKLTGRIQREPLNLVATIIFFAAIVHTFLVNRFRKIAHSYQQSYEAIEYLLHAKDGPPDFGKKHDKLLFRAQLFYFLGEVEAVFGVWLIPLFVAIIAFHGWSTMVDYVGNVNVADAIFVVVIMAMASSLPIIRFTETVIARVSAIGKGNTCFVVVGNSDPGPIARFLHYGTSGHDDLRPSTASSLLQSQTIGAAEVRNARPAVRQHLRRRGIDPVCISAGCDRREHLEMGPGAHANPFRLESCHRDHLVQFAVPHVVSERIRQAWNQHPRRRARSRSAPANPLANYRHSFPLSLLDSSERPLSGACDLGSSFLSRPRLSYAAKPARDRVAVAVTRRVLPSSTSHSRRLPAMVDKARSWQLE